METRFHTFLFLDFKSFLFTNNKLSLLYIFTLLLY